MHLLKDSMKNNKANINKWIKIEYVKKKSR